MSSTGATLSGSYGGATGAISDTGFYYGESSSSLGNKVSSGSVFSPFSKAITGLTANKTYYYKAYVVEGGQEVVGAVQSFKTKAVATATVATADATDIAQTTAVLGGSYSGASGQVDYAGILWGTSSGSVTTELFAETASNPFSAILSGLSPNTTYYFRAFVDEFNENTGSYERRLGSVKTFKTLKVAEGTDLGYLSCYEVPAIGNLNGQKVNGTYTSRKDNWFRYYTSNSSQQVATHTFGQGSAGTGTQTRNYTVLYDESKYAPLWVAYAMHRTTWSDDGTGRTGSWDTDRAIDLTQQTGLDNAQSLGYSRGHMVSSQERQTNAYQNNQTFYYTNQAPQWQNGFNSGVWSSLEATIVTSSPTGRDTLYVVTGVLYEGTPVTKPSGSLNVPIPSHFYKCLMMCSFNASGAMTAATGIALCFTNEAHSGNFYDAAYVTSIDAMESRSGFEFFPNVPASLQNRAEANANWNSFRTSANITVVTDYDWGTL